LIPDRRVIPAKAGIQPKLKALDSASTRKGVDRGCKAAKAATITLRRNDNRIKPDPFKE
jgi:hypothetical protein